MFLKEGRQQSIADGSSLSLPMSYAALRTPVVQMLLECIPQHKQMHHKQPAMAIANWASGSSSIVHVGGHPEQLHEGAR
jgi:hypothetical protein